MEDLINKRVGPVVLAGDFICHVGPEGGPKASGSQNTHGKLLLDMVHNNDLFITSQSSLSSGPSHTYFREDVRTTPDRHAPLVVSCETYDHHPLTTYHSP
jgi:hypothetical protein